MDTKLDMLFQCLLFIHSAFPTLSNTLEELHVGRSS